MSREAVERRLVDFDAVEFSGPATDEDIEELKAMFRWPLPDDYLEFLRTFGAGAVESEEFVGLGGPRHLDAKIVTQRLRTGSQFARFAEHLVPLSGDGGGNYDCIDLERSTRNESFVVEWGHASAHTAELRNVANFWEWLMSMLDVSISR
mgnify:CR=1 FL=1